MKTKNRMGTIAIVAVLIIAVFAGTYAIAAQSRPTPVAQQTAVTVYKNEKASVDASNLAEGYLLIKYTGGKDVRTRVQVIKEAGATYTYDINNKGNMEAYPLSCGDGKYTIKVYENTSGTKYATAYSCDVNLKLRDPFLPYLYPNQFVNYNKDSAVVKKAAEVVAGKTTDMEKLTAVYNYVVNNFTYDYNLAATVQSGYVPVVDTVLSKKTGICFDYAAVMASMLRSQNIPCKLVIGYAGTAYHAWINVYISGEGWVDNAIFFDGKNWSLMDPTYASTGKKSTQAMDFITNKANYSEKFAY